MAHKQASKRAPAKTSVQGAAETTPSAAAQALPERVADTPAGWKALRNATVHALMDQVADTLLAGPQIAAAPQARPRHPALEPAPQQPEAPQQMSTFQLSADRLDMMLGNVESRFDVLVVALEPVLRPGAVHAMIEKARLNEAEAACAAVTTVREATDRLQSLADRLSVVRDSLEI